MHKENDVYIIAEIGGNHEGNIANAIHLVNEAIKSGVDAIKLQIYTGESIVNKIYDKKRVEHFNKFSLKLSEYHLLRNMISDAGVDFIASVWSVDLLHEFCEYMPFIKIGSGDLTCFQMLKEVTSIKKPILLSTGISDLNTIDNSINFIKQQDKFYSKSNAIGILQCTSMYPIPFAEANLNCMSTFKNAYPNSIIGYSDHTEGTFASEIAVSMGAQILELHFTSDRFNESTFRDHKVSFKCETIKQLKRKIKDIYSLMGSHDKKLTKSEIENNHTISFRKSIFYKDDFKSGKIISETDLISLRPMVGMCASKIFNFVGRKLICDVNTLTTLEEKHFE